MGWGDCGGSERRRERGNWDPQVKTKRKKEKVGLQCTELFYTSKLYQFFENFIQHALNIFIPTPLVLFRFTPPSSFTSFEFFFVPIRIVLCCPNGLRCVASHWSVVSSAAVTLRENGLFFSTSLLTTVSSSCSLVITHPLCLFQSFLHLFHNDPLALRWGNAIYIAHLGVRIGQIFIFYMLTHCESLCYSSSTANCSFSHKS